VALLAIPNISEGQDRAVIQRCAQAVTNAGTRVLDVHSDAIHHRSVITSTGTADELTQGMLALALETRSINLDSHQGVHPRLGGLDVCPFVPHLESIELAVETAHKAATLMGEAGISVYLYGEAALRSATKELPDLRRGGIEGLRLRAQQGLPPDFGPPEIDARRGVVCVGARETLIAFNVNLDCSYETAKVIASRVRKANGERSGIRALAFPRPDGSQLSMNLIAPDIVGVDAALDIVDLAAREVGAGVLGTELVGLVPDRYLPAPDAKATRLLIEPGRSLEAVLD
jgi:glutamate formiminotransferase